MNIKLSYHWAIAAFLTVFASCSSDDITTGKVTKPDADKTETNQVSFVAGNQGTRTSLNYGNGDFYWETGDKIFVKDDESKFYASSNAVTDTKVPHFKFMMPGKYTKNSYVVYYPGKNGTDNNVTIAAAQTQNEPDNTMHFGTSGDCGTGEATLEGGQYKFKLTHSAAYLCFKPSYDHPLTSTYVTKIEVTADKDIAGNYTLGSDGKLTAKGTTGSKTITLTPKSAGRADGFKMNNNTAGTSCAAGRMFMVIAPGTYSLTVKYYVKDTYTNVSGVITKKFGSFKYGANDYYDIVSKLDIYAAGKYYMWDAEQDYWYQHENDQQKVVNVQGSNSPTSADADRWYNKAKFPTAASNSAKSCPNINELFWYCLKGDPHWDDTTLWAVWGHLYTGGMWFKKASVIASENGKTNADALKIASPDNGKNRAAEKVYETPPHNDNVTKQIPNNRKNYFFLPATGRYENGKLKDFRTSGCYWTSTPEPFFDGRAYNLFFEEGKVTVSNSSDRTNGFRLWTSE